MASTASMTIRFDPQDKQNFSEICERMGLSVSGAITLFVKSVIREKKIPFEIKSEETLDEYVARNEKDILEGIRDLEEGRYVTLSGGEDEFEKLFEGV